MNLNIPNIVNDKYSAFKGFLSKHYPYNNPRKKRMLISAIAICLLLLSSIVYYSLPLKGRLLSVGPQEFTKGFTEEAQVLPLQEYLFYNQVDGKIKNIYVQNGDQVKKDQLLLEIDTADLNYQLASLKAQLTSIEGQRLQSNASSGGTSITQQNLLVEQAEKDALAQEQSLTRAKALYEVGAISKVQYDEENRLDEKAKSNLAIQKNALQLLYTNNYGSNLYFSGQKNALSAQISQLEEKINNAKITAPQDGFVKDITLKTGTFVPFGEYVLSVYQKQGYKLESYVLASDVLGLKSGDTVELTQDMSDGKKNLTGQIQHIDSSAIERISPLGLKENRVKVTLVLQSDTPVVLGSSMDVKFTTAKESDQLVVPKTAIFSYQEGYAVWIVKNGKAKIQPVVKGLENDQYAVIQEGLNDGAMVLLDTELTGLKEGKRISNSAS